MFKNYIKSALRNHAKNKWNTLINIGSLAIGIACCILIFVYVSDEFSFDQFHKNGDMIYQIYYRVETTENDIYNLCLHPHSLVSELQKNYPAVKNVTCYQSSQSLIEYNNKRFIENFARVDTTFLTMFSFPLLAGDPQKALSAHDKILISETVAEKFFGDLNNNYSQIIGKVITIYGWRHKKEYMISGIMKSVPKNSSLQFDLLMLKEENNYYSRSDNAFGELLVFVQLKKGFNPDDVQKSLQPLAETMYGEPITELKEKGVLKNNSDCFFLKMQSLRDVYFNREISARYVLQSAKIYSYILIGIGLLILTLACINFINLSIGQSLTRTLEVGVRKVLGAGRRQIIMQYSVEKLILIVLAIISGYAIADFLLPMFNQLSQKELTISIFNNLNIPIFLVVLLLASSIFAAGIPSLVLSRFNPAGIFKALSKLGGKSRINSVLIIVQFFLSIVLLSSSFIMSRQISYIHNKELGFNKDHIIVIPVDKEKSDLYKNTILSYPQVINASGCDRNFSNGNSSRLFQTRTEKPVEVNIIRIEEEYINTLDIALLQGRGFSSSHPGDKLNGVIINERLVKDFDLQKPIGTILNGYMFNDQKPQIIGVVKDFHIHSMREEIPPLILHMTDEINGSWSLLVKIKGDNIRETIDILKKEWQKTIPDREFRYTFLSDDINLKYQSEERWQKITGISTLFAFLISSLGLLGLVIIIINTRTKEIGIRKVLGASTAKIVAILTKDVAKWIILANVLAWPVTWYAMTRWLDNFVYKIEISWLLFLLAGIVALTIALLSVSLQTLKAALANPVEALRYE